MSDYYLCDECKELPVPAGPPGGCTSCARTISTKPRHLLCPKCSVATTFPRCERCGRSGSTVSEAVAGKMP